MHSDDRPDLRVLLLKSLVVRKWSNWPTSMIAPSSCFWAAPPGKPLMPFSVAADAPATPNTLS